MIALLEVAPGAAWNLSQFSSGARLRDADGRAISTDVLDRRSKRFQRKLIPISKKPSSSERHQQWKRNL